MPFTISPSGQRPKIASWTSAFGSVRRLSATYRATSLRMVETLQEPQLANQRAFGVLAIFANAAFSLGTVAFW